MKFIHKQICMDIVILLMSMQAMKIQVFCSAKRNYLNL